jgi:hypothetical protein
MAGISSVQKPYEGVSPQPNPIRRMRTDEADQRLIDTLWRRRQGVSRGEEARERRSGEIPIKASVSSPGRAKPKGATSGRCAKHIPVARDSRKGQSPETAARRAGPCTSCVRVYRRVNGRWVLPDGNGRIPCERRKLRRANPRSAAGAKQNRQGFEGSKPSRG